MKFFIIYLALAVSFISATTRATPQTVINQPTGAPRGLVVIAPAKKYLMQERLFEGLAQNLSRQGLIVVRFNWDSQTLSDPALELQKAAEDVKNVVSQAQRYFRAGPQHTILISKSFSTKALGPSLGLAKAQVLLTPNCSAEAPFAKTYEQFLQHTNFKTSIFISNEDPYCDVRQIRQAKIQTPNPPELYLTHGDHNFVEQTQNTVSAKPQNIYQFQDAVIQMVTVQVLKELSSVK